MNERSTIVHTHVPCINPKCMSSDAMCVYDDGHGYCYSCSQYFSKDDLDKQKDLWYPSYNNTLRVPKVSTVVDNYRKQEERIPHRMTVYSPTRGLSLETMKFYDVSVDKDYYVFSYGPSFSIKRSIHKKEFVSSGFSQEAKLFGQTKFDPGQAMAVTITEGAFDAMAVYQMMGSKYPVVSVRSAATALADCKAQHKYLDSFDKIYLCFDADGPGQEAQDKVARLFNPNKVYNVQLSKYKDANEYLLKDEAKAFVSLWFNAKRFIPKGIINSFAEIEDVLNRKGTESVASYPFASLNEKAYGIRIGEVNLFLAQEKVGKTEVFRAIEHHLLATTSFNLGIIHLEEEEKRTVQGLVGYELGKPVHLPDAGVSTEEQLSAYKKLVKTEGRVNIYSHFGTDNPDDILDIIRYLVTVLDCKFVFLDHITMMVTGLEDEDERKKLDYLSTKLGKMCRDLKFTLFLISHVNDNGKTRGSRNISKIADLLVSLDRDIESNDPEVRNTTHVVVKGNRFGSHTGPCTDLFFDFDTFKISEKKNESIDTEAPMAQLQVLDIGSLAVVKGDTRRATEDRGVHTTGESVVPSVAKEPSYVSESGPPW